MPITTLDPTSALVLIDLQNGVAALPVHPHSSADVIARSAALADAFRERGLPVVLVRVSFAVDGGDIAPGRTDALRPRRAMADGWDAIVPELAGHPGDIIVTKHNWGAFYGTDLDLQLRRRGVSQVVLGGIATTLGVESSARAAHETRLPRDAGCGCDV